MHEFCFYVVLPPPSFFRGSGRLVAPPPGSGSGSPCAAPPLPGWGAALGAPGPLPLLPVGPLLGGFACGGGSFPFPSV